MKIAVIPARGGSKRIPRKNIKPFHGKPMIGYAIQAALTSKAFDRVIVSTDDAEIAEVAKAHGAELPFVRPQELADDHTPTVPVIAHAIRACDELGWNIEDVCCIYPGVPFISTDDLRAAHEQLVSTGAHYVFPVTGFPSPIQRALRRLPDGSVRPFQPEHAATRTQDLEPGYFDVGQFYWGRKSAWLDGLNIHFGCIDELHAHKTRTVYDVVETGTGKRDNSLLWVITTAGSNRSGICYEVRTFLTKLLDGVFDDPSQFGIIYGLDDGDDWTSEVALVKANPNWGISVRSEVLAPLQAKAMQLPSAINNFKTKHLNEWVNADTAWMDMRAWDACADASLDLEAFAGQPCWIGLDLASKTDIAALMLVFAHPTVPDAYAVFGKYYLPEDTVNGAGNSQYSGWMRAGRLTVTPGNVIDFSWIEADLSDLVSRFAVQAVAFDPFQATQLSTRMLAEGLPMIEVRPTVLNFSEPMKGLEALVLQRKLIHDGDPVLGWMASNVVAHLDAKDNIYPRKERPENKIDGIVALIMALSRAIQPGDTIIGSGYELVVA